MFNPKKVYYETKAIEYELGVLLKEKFNDVEWVEIDSHNNIPELRAKSNSDFNYLKQLLIIGTRKTHRYVPNEKVSDYLTPWTSSGCSAACLYCYLVCNYNKCSYLRLFVNREEMMSKLIKQSRKYPNAVFEIGSNSDLVLENVITNNLEWTIKEYSKICSGRITFPTKFDMVESILPLEHGGRVIARVSINPEIIINRVELGTSSLAGRVRAINDLCEADYGVGIILAPIILIDNWKIHYEKLLIYLNENLSVKAKKSIFIEIIFMTYSYVQNAINTDAFINHYPIFNKEIMRGRGRGKYCYKADIKNEASKIICELINKYLKGANIIYIA